MYLKKNVFKFDIRGSFDIHWHIVLFAQMVKYVSFLRT